MNFRPDPYVVGLFDQALMKAPEALTVEFCNASRANTARQYIYAHRADLRRSTDPGHQKLLHIVRQFKIELAGNVLRFIPKSPILSPENIHVR